MPAGPKRKIREESLPDYSRRIRELRGKTRQGEFAQTLGVSPMAVSHWENGTNEPGSKMYLKLAQMAHGSEKAWFADRARTETTDLAIKLFIDSTVPSEKFPPQSVRFIDVPLVAGLAGAGPGRIDEREEILGYMSVPRDMCRHPEQTRLIQIKGQSMEPTIMDGAYTGVDRSERQLEKLRGKVVAAWSESEGIVVKRLIEHEGKWVLASDRVGYPTLPFDQGWQIVGRAIFGIQKFD